MSRAETQTNTNCFQSTTRNIQMWANQVNKATTFRSYEICAWLGASEQDSRSLVSLLSPHRISRAPSRSRWGFARVCKVFLQQQTLKTWTSSNTQESFENYIKEKREKHISVLTTDKLDFFFSQWAFFVHVIYFPSATSQFALPKELRRLSCWEQLEVSNRLIDGLTWLWKDVWVIQCER